MIGIVGLFELAPFGVALPLLSAWIYKFIFNHELIRNSHLNSYKNKARINERIEKVNYKHGCKLLHVDVDDEDGEVYTHKHDAFARQKYVHRTAGALFSIVIAISLELTFALMVQMTDFIELDPALFQWSIRLLVVLVAIVQPLLIISLYVTQDLSPPLNTNKPGALFKWGLTVLLCGAWFMILGRVGSLAHALEEPGYKDSRSFMQHISSDIVLAGVTFTAVLSGVGSTSTPFRWFWERAREKRSERKVINEVSVNDHIQSYNNTKMLLRKRQQELENVLSKNSGSAYNEVEQEGVRSLKGLRGSGKKLFNKVSSFASLSAFTRQKPEDQELTLEIDSLKSLKESIYDDVAKNVDKFVRTKERAPLQKGIEKVASTFSFLFSFYCVYRVLSVLFIRIPSRYFWQSESMKTKDALAITIAKLIQTTFTQLPIPEQQLVNQVSFFLSGSLFACSFQNVLVTVKTLTRVLPAASTNLTAQTKTWLKHLLVSEFLAIYIVATAQMIKSNLPPELSRQMNKLLSLTPQGEADTETEFLDTWFDRVFGITCVVTLVVLAAKYFVEAEDDYDYDEESMLEDTKQS
ncbi:uncharacterized protein CXQ87_001965 [Candidozyma duobushaemuli]|uniref:Abscisic acid G-protein coupled receptor-like domain-containing protein n=2 Tax=Candidozyma TaxID=3303203 RepID=A0ABX8IB51_9ASCO|nr:uncharacterized protein CXQ87_001965 [[Candida] duobushaemulonis]PVH13847.1 hypothetical protein CXQ87_001965 [[Candida] duobushaemulonis]QWU87926.1 hypothetical protein CA3LBN_002191 [[Candida] haemuloni]